MLKLLKEAFREFSSDNAPRLAAALAYFALFSIAPLLVIAISLAGLFLGQAAAEGRVVGELSGVLGNEGAEGIQTMIEGASNEPGQGVMGMIGGLVALLFGASGVFNHLKNIMNTIWDVPEPPKKGFMATVWGRLWSIGMVLAVGFILLVSLLLSAVLSGVGATMSEALPFAPWVWQAINAAISLLVITLLFAAIYKYIPDTQIEWRDVWGGAVFTAVLFVVGKLVIGLYLGKSAIASSYGAAASIIVVLLWLYYSSLILFFGAEFTEVWARRRQGIRTRSERRGRARAAGTPAHPEG